MTVRGETIEAYRTLPKGPKHIYLLAGVHGDEPEGIFLLGGLFSWLKEQKNSPLPLMVIPVLNRDGHTRGTRTNAREVDLNRNLPSSHWTSLTRLPRYHPGPFPLSEPENIFLDKLFRDYKPGLILSFHSWKPMLNYNGNCREVALFLQKYTDYTVCADIEDYPTPGSLGEYAPEGYGAGVLTYECLRFDDGATPEGIWEGDGPGLCALLDSPLIHQFL